MDRDNAEDRLESPRQLREEGAFVRIATLPEIQEAWLRWAKRYGKARKRTREVEDGETKGGAHAGSRLVLWFLSLNEDDQARIQDEGEVYLRRLRMLAPRDDRPVIERRRTESVLLPDRPTDGRVGKQAGGSTQKGRLGPKRKGKSKGTDEPVETRPDRVPVGVEGLR